MPISYSSRGRSAGQVRVIFLDWTRRIMQLAVVATALLYAYVLYGLLFGEVGHWATLNTSEKHRIAENISGAIFYLNIALGILLVTLCILYYDEEPLGYTLIATSVALYYGLPFVLDSVLGNQLAEWEKTKNQAALAIVGQLKIAALMMAFPGGALAVRDLILRVTQGSSRKREEFHAMQYGGSVREEAPPNKPLLGIMAKCWQLPFCRDAIRKGCPIYHARTRCWRERVGCMCEENVIRHAMDAIIGKELISTEEPQHESLIRPPDEPAEQKEPDKTEEFPVRVAAKPPSPRNVKIPHNPNLPMRFKIERCKNCVIYNEHQRMKYQFFAPLFVIAVPGLAFWQLQALSDLLTRAFATVDSLMAKLSLAAGGGSSGVMTSLGSVAFANYLILGCLVIIVTTTALRFLEFCVFRLKI